MTRDSEANEVAHTSTTSSGLSHPPDKYVWQSSNVELKKKKHSMVEITHLRQSLLQNAIKHLCTELNMYTKSDARHCKSQSLKLNRESNQLQTRKESCIAQSAFALLL